MANLDFPASEIASKDDIDQAAQGCVQKVKGNGHTYQVYAVGNTDGSYDEATLTVENNGLFETGLDYGDIPRRQGNGNLLTNTPVKELDCVNKQHIDALPCVKNTYERDEYYSVNSPNQNSYIDLYDDGDIDISADGHNININGAKIVNVATPENDNDAATKGYADSTAKLKMPRIKESDQDLPKAIVVKQSAQLQEIDGILYPADSDYIHMPIDVGYYKGSPKRGALVMRDGTTGNLWTGDPIDDQDCVPYSMYKELLDRVEALEQKA